MTCQLPLPMPTLAVASGLKLYSGEPPDTPNEKWRPSFSLKPILHCVAKNEIAEYFRLT